MEPTSTPPDAVETRSALADVLGFTAVGIAVIGLCDLPIAPRLLLLACSSICFPLSFFFQARWPPWVRWCLALSANAFLAYVAWSAIRDSGL
jgi:hypothetical protein